MKKMMRFALVLALTVVGAAFALDPVDAVALGWQAVGLAVSLGGWELMKLWDRQGKI